MRSLAARDCIAHEAPTAPESASGDSSVQGSPGSSGSSLAVIAREAATLASQSARRTGGGRHPRAALHVLHATTERDLDAAFATLVQLRAGGCGFRSKPPMIPE